MRRGSKASNTLLSLNRTGQGEGAVKTETRRQKGKKQEYEQQLGHV